MTTPELLQEWKALCDAATEGPWEIWEGVAYEGGGEDLCIGAGEEWLANMDHPNCIRRDEHFECYLKEETSICTIDTEITRIQRANAEFIKAARTAMPRLIEALECLLAPMREAVNGADKLTAWSCQQKIKEVEQILTGGRE